VTTTIQREEIHRKVDESWNSFWNSSYPWLLCQDNAP
jgi:hypothetical protein